MLLGSLNHVSITVSDLDEAMGFFRPVLRLLGFSVAEPIRDPSSGSRLTVNLNPNGLALNVWEASPALAGERFEVYAPGLHHIAFNVARHAEIASVSDSRSIIVALMTPTSTEIVSSLSNIRTVVVSSGGAAWV